MKKINLEEFIKKSGERVMLSTEERARMHSVLSEYMAMKPVRLPASADANLSDKNKISLFHALSIRFMAASLIGVLILSGAGVSYAANGALPGDVLYPVKVSFNEEVKGLVAVSPEAKAEWATARAEKRLEEASTLAAQGKLTPKAEEQLAAHFEENVAVAEANVSKLSKQDSPAAIEVASDFETDVAAHLAILDEVGEGKNIRLRNIALKKTQAISDIRTSAENGIAVSVVSVATVASDPAAASGVSLMATESVQPSKAKGAVSDSAQKNAAARMGQSAKATLKQHGAILAKARGNLDARMFDESVGEIVAEAKVSIEKGDTAFGSGSFGVAFHAYQQAFVSLKKLNVLLKTASANAPSFSLHESRDADTAATSAGEVPSFTKNTQTKSEAFSVQATEIEDDTLPPSIRILPLEEEVELHGEGSTSTDSDLGSVENRTRIQISD